MNRKLIFIIVALAVVVVFFSVGVDAMEAEQPGLIGGQYGSDDFDELQNLTRLNTLERVFSEDDDYGTEWSARWAGFIIGPASGEINFTAETDQVLEVRIAGTRIVKTEKGAGTGGFSMVKGKQYPIEVTFVKDSGDSEKCFLKIQWGWASEPEVTVPRANLVHTAEQEQKWTRMAQEAEDDDDDDDDDDEREITIDIDSATEAVRNRLELAEEFLTSKERAGEINLSRAVIVTASDNKIISKAAEMLRDEIEKRTRVGIEVVSTVPASDKVVVLLGRAENLAEKSFSPSAGLSIPFRTDAYAIWVDKSKRSAATICAAGYDDRGTLYAVGRLLRLLDMSRDEVKLAGAIKIATAPKYPLRGHQMGYRPKTNSYDGWTIEMWEQYFRDMVAFGMNAVELVPPRTDDRLDSPLFPKPPLEMMVEMSLLADEYGLDVWIWYPAIDEDYLEPATMKFALAEREEIFRRLPRIDAVFVPGGDPGEIHPRELFPLMKEMKKILNRYHPQAEIWSSTQNYDDEQATMGWSEAFYKRLRGEAGSWFDGVVFGPAVETSLERLRREVAEKYPIRRYPDITHSRDCQYGMDDEQPGWDEAYSETLGREPINPRPRAFARIFRDLQQYAIGFISYSEGCNDDFNKVLWSSLGWEPEMQVEDIVKEYSRYFISRRFEQAFALGLLALEQNWQGPLDENEGVFDTLRLFQAMEQRATPQELHNWRFQQGLYRAYYDAYIKARLEYERDLERQAKAVLKRADKLGSLEALDRAEAILDKAVTDRTRDDLRARVFELAEALFQSIRMQLSVPKYYAKELSRGANLDSIDAALNNSPQLKQMFDKIRRIKKEDERLAMISDIADR